MKGNREFDMLENADNKTVELLSEVPVLTKDEKERMLAMSKKKLDKMQRENNITENTNDEYEVSGVERYNRPKWQMFASLAACLLLVGGIGGTVFAMSKNGGPTSKPLASVEETTTEPATVHDLLTEVTTVEATTVQILVNEDELLSENELMEAAYNLMNDAAEKYGFQPVTAYKTENYNGRSFDIVFDNKVDGGIETVKVTAVFDNGAWTADGYDVISQDLSLAELGDDIDLQAAARDGADIVNDISRMINGKGVEVDENDSYTQEFENIDEPVIYDRVTDERFSCLDDVIDYFEERICSDYLDNMINAVKGNPYSAPVFYEKEGALYLQRSTTPFDGFDFTGQFEVSGEQITPLCVRATVQNGNLGEEIMLIFMQYREGKWKVSSYKYM